jgi:hypothetical protein
MGFVVFVVIVVVVVVVVVPFPINYLVISRGSGQTYFIIINKFNLETSNGTRTNTTFK